MQRTVKGVILGAVSIGLFVLPLLAQTRVSVLLEQLQSRRTSDQAKTQLLELAHSDASARMYLATHLPPLIEADPRDPRPYRRAYARPQWLNAVRLAGELRLADAAPALTKWIEMRVPFGITSQNMEEGLLNSPAGYALYQIGDPAIPAVERLLAQGDRDERFHAAYVLAKIDSPQSIAVLREYEKNGKDRELANYLKTNVFKGLQHSLE
jgi:HEAT repeat protein